MASRSAVINLGVALNNTSMKGAGSVAIIWLGATQSAQPFAGGSGLIGTQSLLRTRLPSAQVPIGAMADGSPIYMNPTWYRFFDFIANVQLGGPQGPSVTDLSTTVVSTRSDAIQAQQSVSALTQQTVANAQALGAVVQVTQTSSLPGASQIPPVVYTPPSYKSGE